MYYYYLNQAFSLLPTVEQHKGCGGTVKRQQYLPGWYSCPKCNTLLHGNNVERVSVAVA